MKTSKDSRARIPVAACRSRAQLDCHRRYPLGQLVASMPHGPGNVVRTGLTNNPVAGLVVTKSPEAVCHRIVGNAQRRKYSADDDVKNQERGSWIVRVGLHHETKVVLPVGTQREDRLASLSRLHDLDTSGAVAYISRRGRRVPVVVRAESVSYWRDLQMPIARLLHRDQRIKAGWVSRKRAEVELVRVTTARREIIT